MRRLSEAEIQTLIAIYETSQSGKSATLADLIGMRAYFCKSLRTWGSALNDLEARDLLRLHTGAYALTPAGIQAARHWRRARPHMWYWYTDYYRATRTSVAYATFCERAFGRNFAQHGFSDMAQLSKLIEISHLGPADRVLDLGCGNGAMAAYVSDSTGAHVTGIDYIPEAIRQARQRARHIQRLSFHVMNMDALRFPARSFSALISIDTLYFVELDHAIKRMKKRLAPGGQMAIFYAHGVDPQHPLETFNTETLAPEKTPLGIALAGNGLQFTVTDFTQTDYAHAALKKRVIEALKEDLAAEDNLFLYENRRDEANGVIAAIEAGAHVRYLYHVTCP